ncbi:hypothetical protein FN846DRAFT_888570 [Sphaerosporella brunnea]|uniref:Uncharacterized protein n=1 Tax=Sphaerosporella brunnea TaxID=1250544 RepID=A0A5J5F2C3_9PEZI|nr:hypothetical protein FN846DRAFT_888570 [Sphaerosporella brunnea]
MTTYLQTKWGQRLARSLGRAGITAAEFKEIAEDVRALCPIDLASDPRSWTDCEDVEKEIYLDLLSRAYPGIRDAHVFVAFVKHILSVGKSEAKRRLTKASAASAQQVCLSSTVVRGLIIDNWPGYRCVITVPWTGDTGLDVSVEALG